MNFKDFAVGLVLIAPSPPTTGTQLTLREDEGQTMPAVPFNATVCPIDELSTLASAEKINVTNVTGDVITFSRAQGETVAQAIKSGWVLVNAIYAEDVADAYARANHTGTQPASTISDFDTEVSNNTDVTANTAKTGVTTQISNVVDDTTPQLGGDLDVQTFTVDGRDVSTDGIKLDSIESGADVTDTTNVTTSGALMDSEVTNLAQVKAFDTTDYEPAKGVDDNFVTDAEKVVIGNTSNTNTGDQVLPTDFDPAGTDNSTDVTLAGTGTYLSLTGQAITVDPITESDISDLGSYQPLDTVLTNTTASFLTAQETKLSNISVTQAVDLDSMESDIAALDQSVILKGTWDASVGTFPSSAQAGHSYIVSVGGTVGGEVFVANDRIVAILDNASTTVYASNWHKLDYTDQVLSVAGKTGEVTLVEADITDLGTYSTATGVETNADVTDTANVTAAGALMDSEVTNLADVKAFDTADYAAALGTDDNYVTDAEKIVVGNTSGTNTGDEPSASTTTPGIVELATITETNTGTDTARSITPAGLSGSALQTKVDNVAIGATANDTDANLKARANHTGTQTASTISDFDTEVSSNSDVTANTVKVSYTDSAKVAGIENNADVTDTTNVTNAGALMDSEVTNLAQVKAFDSTDYATSAQGTTADNALPKAGGTMTGSIIVPEAGGGFQFGANSSKYIKHGINTSNLISYSSYNGHDFRVWDGSAYAPTLKINRTSTGNGGNVGIGLTNPSERLDVAGNIAVSGTVDGRDVAADGTKLDYITVTQAVNLDTMESDIALKANIRGAVNVQTGTTYTLVIGDEYLDGVRMTNASANTLTIPPNSAVAFPVGTKVFITQGGAGSTSIAAGAGVTINAPSTVTLAIGEQHESRVCQKTGTDTWLLI